MNTNKKNYMKAVRALRIPLLSAAAVLLGGCVVTSVDPFYRENDPIFEPALLGHWTKVQQPDECWTFEQGNGNSYRVVCADKGSTNIGQAYLFKLEGHTFIDFSAPTWKEEIQPEPVPSHILAHVVQLNPTLKLSVLNYDWLKELMAKDPKALRHLVVRRAENPEYSRIVLTADTAELQRFVLKHLNTQAAWETGVELRADP